MTYKKENTKYTFEAGEGHSKLTAVVAAKTKEAAIEKLCAELDVKELPAEWRLTKYDIK